MRSNDVLIFNKILEILTKIRYSMLKPGGGLWHNSPPPVSEWNIFFLSKFLRFWSNYKEYLNEYLIMWEKMTKIFNISSKIRSYVQDFVLNFALRMFAMMVQFLDISTKICDQNFDQDFGDLDHHFRYFTKMFKILALNFIIFL